MPRAYYIDFVVEERLIIDAKAMEHILTVHIAQVQTYLKLSGYRLGLLINFNVRILRYGIRRIFTRMTEECRTDRKESSFDPPSIPSTPSSPSPYWGDDAAWAASRARNSRSIRPGVEAFGFHPRRSTLITAARRPSASASLQFQM